MRRGALKEINGSLNRPTRKCGVDYRILAACAVISIIAFLFASKIFACILLPSLLAAGALITKPDAQMFRLIVVTIRCSASYDPKANE